MSLTKVTYSMIGGAVANILDHGADPTGVADSTAAITAAIAASNAVYIPQGTFKITTLAINKSNFYMFGCGDSSVLQTTVEANIALTIGNTASTENVTLRQFKIQGNSTNLGGIQLGTATNYVAFILLDELTVRDIDNSATGSYGIRLRSVQELEVRNCRLLYNYYNVYQTFEGFVTSTLFCGKKSYVGRGGRGFYLNGLISDITIRDCVIEENRAEGILSDFYADNITISDCYLENNCLGGAGLGHISITGNTVAPYQLAQVNIERCSFHMMTGGAFPNVNLDKVKALLIGNFALLAINAGVVTTIFTSASFVQNKSQGADNPIAVYKALLGNISAIDTDEHGAQFVLARQTAYVPHNPALIANNTTYVSAVDGKLYFRNSAGTDFALN